MRSCTFGRHNKSTTLNFVNGFKAKKLQAFLTNLAINNIDHFFTLLDMKRNLEINPLIALNINQKKLNSKDLKIKLG